MLQFYLTVKNFCIFQILRLFQKYNDEFEKTAGYEQRGITSALLTVFKTQICKELKQWECKIHLVIPFLRSYSPDSPATNFQNFASGQSDQWKTDWKTVCGSLTIMGIVFLLYLNTKWTLFEWAFARFLARWFCI